MNDYQRAEANKSLIEAASKLSIDSAKIAVKIQPSNRFWIAEDYHQDFAEKNLLKYKFYRSACQRDKRLKEVW